MLATLSLGQDTAAQVLGCIDDAERLGVYVLHYPDMTGPSTLFRQEHAR